MKSDIKNSLKWLRINQFSKELIQLHGNAASAERFIMVQNRLKYVLFVTIQNNILNQSACVFWTHAINATRGVKLSETIKTILENAIREEEYFSAFYMKMSEKASDESIKEQLRNLALQEQMHKEAIEALSFEKIGMRVIADKINEIDIEYELTLTPIEEFDNLHDMFKFAIKHETIAELGYERLANAINDADAKKLFLHFADEEKKHKLLLTGKMALVAQGTEVEW